MPYSQPWLPSIFCSLLLLNLASIIFLMRYFKSRFFFQGGYGIGSLLVDLVAGWRYMYGASTPLAVIMGMGMWWLPASPRWLLLCAMKRKGDMQDLRESAISCLCRLRGQSIGDSAPTEVDEILTELSYVGEDKEVSLREVFHGKCLKALIIGAGLVLFQQVS